MTDPQLELVVCEGCGAPTWLVRDQIPVWLSSGIGLLCSTCLNFEMGDDE